MLSQLLSTQLSWATWCLLAVLLLAAALIYSFIYEDRPYPNIPIVGKVPWDFLNMKTKERFVRYANEVLAQGMAEVSQSTYLYQHSFLFCPATTQLTHHHTQHPTHPFQVNGANGPLIILPAAFAEEIRNDPRLSFTGVIEQNFFPHYSGLEIFSPIGPGNDILQEVVRKHLTLSLDTLTPALSDEMSVASAALLTPNAGAADGNKWQALKFFHVAPELTARVSSRAFLGAPLCRDPTWLSISVKYTIDSFFAVRALRVVPPVLRPVAHRFLPEMRVVRDEVKAAKEVVGAEVELRRRARFEAEMRGEEVKSDDAIAWFDEVAGEREYDIVREQMMLSVAAIHTTSITLMALLYDLAENPEWIERVREEVVAVLREDGGWMKNTLYKMKLLDSCMKESQRLHTVGAREFSPPRTFRSFRTIH